MAIPPPDKRGQSHLDFRWRKIFPEHLTHHAVEPAQMPRRLFLLQTCNSSHYESESFRAMRWFWRDAATLGEAVCFPTTGAGR